jgi:REP element-mobilizing transposase RayT
MANSYTQLYVHAVFAVKYRQALLTEEIQSSVFGVIGQLFNEHKCKTVQVNGVEDHVHALFRMKPVVAVSDVMQAIKAKSSLYINATHLTPERFEWQEGYGAFSLGTRQLDATMRHILDQHRRHRTQPFLDEYIELLTENGILFSPEFLFTEPV